MTKITSLQKILTIEANKKEILKETQELQVLK